MAPGILRLTRNVAEDTDPRLVAGWKADHLQQQSKWKFAIYEMAID
jgi:hypothetical protein